MRRRLPRRRSLMRREAAAAPAADLAATTAIDAQVAPAESPAWRCGGSPPRRPPTRLTLHRAPPLQPAPRPPPRPIYLPRRQPGRSHQVLRSAAPARKTPARRTAAAFRHATRGGGYSVVGRGSQREGSCCHGGIFHCAVDTWFRRCQGRRACSVMRLAPGRPHCCGAPDRARRLARHARGHREAVPLS